MLPVITPGIAHSFQAIIDPGSLVVILLQVILDDLGIGFQNGDFSLLFLELRKGGIFEMPLDGVAVNPANLGDFPNTISVATHGNNVHKYLLGDHRYPLPF